MERSNLSQFWADFYVKLMALIYNPHHLLACVNGFWITHWCLCLFCGGCHRFQPWAILQTAPSVNWQRILEPQVESPVCSHFWPHTPTFFVCESRWKWQRRSPSHFLGTLLSPQKHRIMKFANWRNIYFSWDLTKVWLWRRPVSNSSDYNLAFTATL